MELVVLVARDEQFIIGYSRFQAEVLPHGSLQHAGDPKPKLFLLSSCDISIFGKVLDLFFPHFEFVNGCFACISLHSLFYLSFLRTLKMRY